MTGLMSPPTRPSVDKSAPRTDEDSTTWYHGTRVGFRGRGGILMPRAYTRAAGTTAPLNPGRVSPAGAGDWCFITRDPEVAQQYAKASGGRGKPKVLVVQPHGAVVRDPEHSLYTDAWRCEWATVLETRILV